VPLERGPRAGCHRSDPEDHLEVDIANLKKIAGLENRLIDEVAVDAGGIVGTEIPVADEVVLKKDGRVPLAHRIMVDPDVTVRRRADDVYGSKGIVEGVFLRHARGILGLQDKVVMGELGQGYTRPVRDGIIPGLGCASAVSRRAPSAAGQQ
jgi:hypothetical protein